MTATTAQLADMGEALADALHAVVKATPGTPQQNQAMVHAIKLHAALGVYLQPVDTGTPASNLLLKE